MFGSTIIYGEIHYYNTSSECSLDIIRSVVKTLTVANEKDIYMHPSKIRARFGTIKANNNFIITHGLKGPGPTRENAVFFIKN